MNMTGGRKSPGVSATSFLRMLLVFACCFVTYNFFAMQSHHWRHQDHDVPLQAGREGSDASSSRSGSVHVGGGDRAGAGIPGSRGGEAPERAAKRKYHVALTASSALYSQWQSRIMYYWCKQMRDRPGSEMGGFTRILHSGVPDGLMNEIPTFVVDPLPEGADRGYVVLHRPWAFVQWLEQAKIEEEYIFMAEPDHLLAKPMPNIATENEPAAFPFFYITPIKHEKILRKYFPEERGPITNIDPIGNSPVIIKKAQLEKIAPTWMNISISMKQDKETDEAFGWVLEMYGYAVASALHGVRHDLHEEFMIETPRHFIVGRAYIIHFCYPLDYTSKAELTYGKVGDWRFDKRFYMMHPPHTNHPMPPWGVPESVVTQMKMINEAMSNIPGWDDE